jgi:putative tricarboxylic transport membrane protein
MAVGGYQMALNGRAGPALGIAAFGSFIAGTFSIVGLMILAAPLARAALRFGPPEFFSLVLMGLTLVTYLSQKSAEKAFMSALIGMLLSWVGMDLVNGTPRFTFGLLELNDGIAVIPIVMGLFGISEVFFELEKDDQVHLVKTKIVNLLPTREDWRECKWPISGSFGSLNPAGRGGYRVSYYIVKRLSNTPSDSKGDCRCGRPESANTRPGALFSSSLGFR